jgi:hypothetical protein
MAELKRFVELTLAESNRHVLIALEDIQEVIEELKCEGKIGKDFREYKVIHVFTSNHNSYMCDYSDYAKLKHYLTEWKE